MSRHAFLNARSGNRTNEGFSLSAITGTVAAALAANSSVFVLRHPAASTTTKLVVERIHVQYTCLAAFTTPVTVGRRLALFRGAGADSSGGTAVVGVKKNSGGVALPVGLSCRVATTGALTVAGITFETDAIRALSLVAYGASGATYDEVWRDDGNESDFLTLNAGELVAIRAPQLFDAAGTWEAQIDVDCFEAPAGLLGAS